MSSDCEDTADTADTADTEDTAAADAANTADTAAADTADTADAADAADAADTADTADTADNADPEFKDVLECLGYLEMDKDEIKMTQLAIVFLEEENIKLKEENVSLEKKVEELEARLERLLTHYQAELDSGQDLKSLEEKLLKSAPKALEEENAALSNKISDLEVELYNALEEKKQEEEKFALHEESMDRLVDLMAHLMGGLNDVEVRLQTLDDDCSRIKPAAENMAQLTVNLQLSCAHSQCCIEQLIEDLDEQHRLNAVDQGKLAETVSDLEALSAETDAYKAGFEEQQEMTIFYMNLTTKLKEQVKELEDKLEEAEEVIRDQSEVLALLRAN